MLEKQDNTIKSHIMVERAIDELRRQMGVVIQDDSQTALALFPIEFASDADIASLKALGPSHLLLTGSRARSLKLTDAPDTAWAVDAASLPYDMFQALADPACPYTSTAMTLHPASEVQRLGLQLAKYASLLPALICVPLPSGPLPDALNLWHRLDVADIRSYIQTPLLDVVEMASASLPIHAIEHSRIISFRARYGTAVHLALLIGDITKAQAPLVRVHSSCVTGDILGSLRCDCGDQLQLAIDQMAEEGCGILLYLHQEGRGIGINNKLRAYQLQERGLDTFDANLLLGFEEDERDFAIASAILNTLRVGDIRLLTNNPHKLEALKHNGTRISGRVGLVAKAGRHNHAYLEAKEKKSGHFISNT
jgi:GTP cyclohydrolase II